MYEMVQLLALLLTGTFLTMSTRVLVAPLWRWRDEEEDDIVIAAPQHEPTPQENTKPVEPEEPYSIFEETARWHGVAVRAYVPPPDAIVHSAKLTEDITRKPLQVYGWHNHSCIEVTSWN